MRRGHGGSDAHDPLRPSRLCRLVVLRLSQRASYTADTKHYRNTLDITVVTLRSRCPKGDGRSTYVSVFLVTTHITYLVRRHLSSRHSDCLCSLLYLLTAMSDTESTLSSPTLPPLEGVTFEQHPRYFYRFCKFIWTCPLKFQVHLPF